MFTSPTKRILCFWDSLTRWYIPWTNHERYAATERWTWILQDKLWNEFEIIEEWLNSRTLSLDDPRPGKEWKNWSEYIMPCLDTHDPLDLVILSLGINETKHEYEKTAEEMWEIIENNYIKPIMERQFKYRKRSPKILLVSPHFVNYTTEYVQQRFLESNDKIKKLWEIYEQIAKKYNWYFLNSSLFLTAWVDGVHLDKENNILFAEKVYDIVKEINFM